MSSLRPSATVRRTILPCLLAFVLAPALHAAPPVAVNDTAGSTNENSAFNIPISSLTANDTLEGASFSLVGTPTPAGVTVTIQGGNVVFNPTGSATLQALPAGGSANATFQYRLTNGDGQSTATVTVPVTGVNDAPTIAGINTNLSTGDNQPINPFSNVTLADVDTGATLTVTLGVTVPAEGTLSSTSLSGTPAQVTAAIRAVVFTPNQNIRAPQTTGSTHFNLSVSDGIASPVANNSTRVTVTSINDAPVATLLGTAATDLFTSNSTSPFQVTVSDADFPAIADPPPDPPAPVWDTINTIQMTITATGGEFTRSGTLSGPQYSPASSGTTITRTGTYTLAEAEQAIAEAVYTAQNTALAAPLKVRISLTVTDSFGGVSSPVHRDIVVTSPTAQIVNLPQNLVVADNSTIAPFTSTAINGFGTNFAIRLTLDDDRKGAFENLGTFTKSAGVVVTGSSVDGDYLPSSGSFASGDNTLTHAGGKWTLSGASGNLYQMSSANPADPVGIYAAIDGSGATGTAKVGRTYTSPVSNETQAVAALRQIVFRPVTNRVNQYAPDSAPITIHIELLNGAASFSPQVTGAFDLGISAINDEPQLAGVTTTEFRINDDQTVNPFPNVIVQDPDEQGLQLLTVLVSADNAAKGGFVDLSGTQTPPVTPPDTASSPITLTGTPSQIQAALRALTFVPTENRLPVDDQETAILTLRITDARGAVRTNNQTRVIVRSIDGAPEFTGLIGDSTSPAVIPPAPPVLPFPAFGLSDDNATLTLVITLDNAAKGTLALPDGSAFGSAFNPDPGSGIYEITASVADTVTIVRSLVFSPNPSFTFPPATPGGTTFHFSVTDGTGNVTSLAYSIVIADPPRNWLVTSKLDDGSPGSLRSVVASAKTGDWITFALPEYPSVIRLSADHGPIALAKNLTISGPGPAMLTLSGDSNGDGTADVQIFRVSALASISGLTLSHGIADTGGAIKVTSTGSLLLTDAILRHNKARQWGGGIDVDGGRAVIDRSLFLANTTDASLGRGGSAIAFYSEKSSSIRNSTFSGNSQFAAAATGGATVYAENSNPGVESALDIAHCTFADNFDAADRASSIRSTVFNSRVRLLNSIVADDRGKNLGIGGSGSISSLGGNISDDATRTTLQGAPGGITLLNRTSDLRDDLLSTPAVDIGVADILTKPILELGGQTRAYAPVGGGPAVSKNPAALPTESAASPAAAVDQRGVFRHLDGAPDRGALEAGVFGRLLIHEIHFDPAAGPAFVEIYNPRDSEAVNIGGYMLRVNGVVKHIFSPGLTIVPGEGVVVADAALTLGGGNFTPVQIVSSGPLGLGSEGLIELVHGGQVLISQRYLGRYVNPFNPTDTTLFANQSITLSPQFLGAFVPSGIVNSPPFGGADLGKSGAGNTPGADSDGTPFGASNAPPLANDDSVITNEDTAFDIDVLANDFDADRPDELRVVSLSPAPGQPGSTSIFTSLGARVDIVVRSTDTPGVGPANLFKVFYDPRPSAILRALPVGAEVTDSFAYTILDFEPNGGPGKSPTTAAEALVQVKVLGVNDPPVPQADLFATDEETILRLMGDTLAGPAPTFDTDSLYLAPRAIAPGSLLGNDIDHDADDSAATLMIVGVVRDVHPVGGYTGVQGETPVRVQAPGHGLSAGARILIAGYGGDPLYNRYHLVTPDGPDAFTIPVPFTGNHATPGVFAVVSDATRLATTTGFGAEVRLEIRADRSRTNIVYNPRTSDFLNRLSVGDMETDGFHYVVEDRHGAAGFAPVSIGVHGVNDIPATGFDPTNLARLSNIFSDVLASPSAATPAQLADAVAGLVINHQLPSTAEPGVALVSVAHPDSASGSRSLELWVTREDEIIDLPAVHPSDPRAIICHAGDIDRNDTLSVKSVSASRLGAATAILGTRAQVLAGAAQSIRYDPSVSATLRALSRDEPRIDTFQYTIEDGRGGESSSIVAVLVLGKNEAPTAIADYRETDQDTVLQIASPASSTLNGVSLQRPLAGLLANDLEVDIDGTGADDLLAIIPSPVDPATGLPVPEATSVAGASVIRFADGTAVYDPTGSSVIRSLPRGEAITDTFEYTLIDNSLVFANNDRFKVRADGSDYRLNVLANDATLTGGHPAGSAITQYSGIAGQQPVTVTSTGHGLVNGTRVLIEGYSGSGAYNGIHHVTVTGPNTFTIPAAFSDNASTKGLWKEAVEIAEIGTPDRGGSVSIIRNSPAGSGIALSYTPAANFVGDETFSYRIRDSRGGGDIGYVTVRSVVNQLNGNLQANHDQFAIASGQTALLDVLANDNIIPASGADLTLAVITAPPANGTAAIENGRIRYTPDPGFSGADDTLTYRISGGGTGTADAVVTIAVIDRTGSLDVRDDFFAVIAGSGGTSLDVLANDGLVSGTTAGLVIDDAIGASHGSVAVAGDGRSVIYTPDPGFLGTDLFTYSVTDNLGGTASATVRISVGRIVTNNDYFTVREFDPGTPSSSHTLDVLANDQIEQAAGGTITITSVLPVGGASGTATAAPDGLSLNYTPAPGANGEHVFDYTVTDSSGRTAVGRVIVNVVASGLNANADHFAVLRDSGENPLDVLFNDAVLATGAGALSIVSVGEGETGPDQGGSVAIGVIDRGGLAVPGLIYTPAAGFVGEETVTYTMTDGFNGSDTTTVVIRVTGGDLNASDDAFTVFYQPPGGSTASFTLPVLSNDSVLPDFGQPLGVTAIGPVQPGIINPPAVPGQIAVAANGLSVIYTPRNDAGPFPYEERFTYEIGDGTARRASGEVIVRVLDRIGTRTMDTNDDTFTVRADSTANLLRVLANDGIKPAPSAGTVITGTSATSHGGAVQITGPTLSYTPAPGFFGVETFTYQVSDGLGGTGFATVRVKVGDVRVTNDRFATTSAPQTHRLNVLENDDLLPGILPSGRILEITAVTSPGSAGGTVTLASAGPGNALLYTPAASHPGPFPYEETFTYQVRDDSGNLYPGLVTVEVHKLGSDRSVAPVTITVLGLNDPPTITGAAAGHLDDDSTFQPFASIDLTDPDLDGQQILRVGITLGDPSLGILRGAFSAGADGYYYFEGTAAQATAAIRGLVFEPAADKVNSGTTAEAVFTVTVDDGATVPPVSDSSTVITIHPVNDPPAIGGALSGIRVHHRYSVKPFTTVTLSDPDDDAHQILTATLSFEPSRGILQNTGGFSREIQGGPYSMTADAETITAALNAMVFAPTTGDRLAGLDSETTTFTLGLSDGVAPAITNSTTTVTAHHTTFQKIGADAATPAVEQFGQAVSLSGRTLAVGAPLASHAGNLGAVRLYQRDPALPERWIPLATVTIPNGGLNQRFGATVALDGDTLVVGAPQDATLGANAGAVYVFGRNIGGPNAWGQIKKLVAAGGRAGDRFGSSVAIHDHTILVGAPTRDNGGNPVTGFVFNGLAFVFDRDQGGAGQWGQTKQLVAPGVLDSGGFGISVAIDGDTLVVGGYLSRVGGEQAGQAFVYERNAGGAGNWGISRSLQAQNTATGHQFGASVAISGDWIAVGAPLYSGSVFRSGAAYLFGRDVGQTGQWGQSRQFEKPAGQQNASEFFGHSVAIHGQRLLVGTPGDRLGTDEPMGAAYFYEMDRGGVGGWGLIDRIAETQRQSDENVGHSVTLHHRSLAVGAPGSLWQDQQQGVRTGAVLTGEVKFNNTPRPPQPLVSLTATAEQSFSAQLPPDGLVDPDIPETLVITATLAGGGPLPAWLAFDPATLTFSGTPASAQIGILPLLVTATDSNGTSGSLAVSIEVLAGGPFLHVASISGVNQDWRAVTLPRSYASMVVVATPVHVPGAPPVVARVRNAAAGNTFELRLQRADNSTASIPATEVRIVVAEQGVYTTAQHGMKLEAHRFLSTATDFRGSWNGQPRAFSNTYSAPVVLGQVMTSNDTRFSAFWARGADRFQPPSPSAFFAGKQVGEDPATGRLNEEIGYLVMEAGTGRLRTVDGTRGFAAGLVVPGLAEEIDPAPAVSFTTGTLAAHAGGNSASFVTENGNGLLVTGSGWRSRLGSVNLTPASVLEFGFASTAQGLVHGIGFDTDASLSPATSYQLFGTATQGLQGFRNYPGDNRFRSYEIPVGRDFTGSFNRIVFGATDTAGSASVNSFFRSVTVLSGATRRYGFARGLSGVEGTALSMSGMTSDDGGWPVLTSAGSGNLGLAIDEDQLGDAERSQRLGLVSYLVVGPANGEIPISGRTIHNAGYLAWLESHFAPQILADLSLEASLWGLFADANRNGVGNLIEYATGRSPVARSGTQPLRIRALAGGDVEVAFDRITGDPTLELILQTSENGTVWQTVTAANTKSIHSQTAAGRETRTHVFEPTPTAHGGRRLFRLRGRFID